LYVLRRAVLVSSRAHTHVNHFFEQSTRSWNYRYSKKKGFGSVGVVDLVIQSAMGPAMVGMGVQQEELLRF
jgi:hypothetical protein